MTYSFRTLLLHQLKKDKAVFQAENILRESQLIHLDWVSLREDLLILPLRHTPALFYYSANDLRVLKVHF